MLTGRFFSLVAIATILFVAPVVFSAPYRIGPASHWVEDTPHDEMCRFSEQVVSNGICHLSVDIQKNLTLPSPEFYYRYTRQILNVTGAEEHSQINITFSPAYENVTLNHITIRRGGKVLNRLRKKNITILRREPRMDRLMYDGNETIHIIVEDVRPGDVVDYAYTLKGRNPALDGHFFDEVIVQFDVPMQRLVYRAVFPATRAVQFKSFLTDISPVVEQRGEAAEYRIVREAVMPVAVEENTPTWYDSYPRIQFSDMADWQAVGRWGSRLYPKKISIRGALREKIEEIARSTDDPEARLSRALRFVQTEIRYLGLEMGKGSFKPRDPATVFERRYGDCKDKSYLLVTLLRELGIDAYPALVNTAAKQRVREMLPSPSVFNHVIVFAQLNGIVSWIDPARPAQRAPFSERFAPDFGVALVLDDTESGLTAMPPRTTPHPTKIIEESLDLSGSPEKPVSFKVKTTLKDEEAVNFEADLDRNGYEDVKKAYFSFYASDYPGIREEKPPVIEKIPMENRVVITEQYRIHDYWTYIDAQSEYQSIAVPKELSSYISLSSPKSRTMPLGLTHPVNVLQTTTITLPEEIFIQPVDEHREDDGMFFGHSVSRNGNVYTTTYHYYSKADHVTADKARAHLALRAEIADNLGYTFHRSNSEQMTFKEKLKSHLPLMLLLFIVLGLTIAGAVFAVRKVYRYDPPTAAPPVTANGQYHVVGGWLALFSLSVISAPVLSLYWIFQMRTSFYFETLDYYTVHTSEGYNALWLPLMMFEGVYHLFFFGFTVLLLVLFFKRRQSFSRVFAWSHSTRIVFHIGDVTACQALLNMPADASDTQSLMKMVMYTFLWSVYLFRSERARGYFRVRRIPWSSPTPQLEDETPPDSPELTSDIVDPPTPSIDSSSDSQSVASQ